MLSERIDDFLKELRKHPENFNMSEVIEELEDFSSRSIDLELEIQDLKDKVDELEEEIRELEEEI